MDERMAGHVTHFVKHWIDRQMAREVTNVIGEPGQARIEILGVAVKCKGGVFLVNAYGEHESIQVQKQ
jgi:hypothetical protein